MSYKYLIEGLCPDTLTRWKNEKQMPTVESIERTVRVYAVRVAEFENLEGEEATSRIKDIETDILARLTGLDGKMAELHKALEKIAEKQLIIKELKSQIKTLHKRQK